jgi:hypothetical protein
MPEIYGLPQDLTGSELVTIYQEQSGQLAKCSMPLSTFMALVVQNVFRNLPTTEPSTAGVPWNNAGVVSIS